MIVHFIILFFNNVAIASRTPFEEIENGFERTTTFEDTTQLSNDFIQLISTAIVNNSQPHNEPTFVDDLHDLKSSLNQYFLTRVFQYFAKKHQMIAEKYHPDPGCLPNTHSEEYPNFHFRQVKVYGFPPLRNTRQLKADMNFEPSSQSYNIIANVSSDVVVITGKFNVSQDDYHFVYQTFRNTYTMDRSNQPADDGLFRLKSINESLTFDDDQLTHTVDSSSANYTQINYLLYPTLKKTIQLTYLPKLAEFTRKFLQPVIRRRMSADAASYHQKALDQLVQQIVRYLTRRWKSTQIILPPMVFSNNKRGNYNPLNFENILLEGVSNFEKYRVEESTTPSANNSLLVFMQDEIIVDYPEDGDKQAHFYFTFRIGKRQVTKKSTIKNIRIKMNYNMQLDRYPVRLTPQNLDEYQFLVKFDLENFDDTYYLVLNYLQSKVSKLVSNAIANNEIAE